MKVPNEYLDLFEKKSFAHVATIMPDGSPQVSPVWVAYDGKYVVVNTAVGRQKDRNMRRDKRVAVEIQDPQNPYRYLMIRGVVVEIQTEGADAGIDELSMRYNGKPYAYKSPEIQRVIYKIEPLHVHAQG